MPHKLVILADFSIAMVPSCECGDLEMDDIMAEAVFLTDMVDEAILEKSSDIPSVKTFAKRLGLSM